MVDFATLVLGAESKELRTAANDLDGVAKKSGEAEAKVDRFSAGMKKAAVAAGAFAASLVSIQAATVAIRGAREFSKAVSEASTLIEGTPAQIKALETASKELAATYGGTATQQVQGFYQAISAGAGSVEEAAQLLDVANKLAVGGVTDTTTAVDALTTATNAYASTGLTAAQASDALFVGIKAGKTTAGELGSALGNVVPIAASLGVSFDEVVAGAAALTTQGQTTSVAVNGLRQILAAVVKPTSEAADAAEALGLQFDVQSLKAEGLAQFLRDVIDATGGSEAELAKLFGSVEALNAVLSFAGGGGAVFTKVLADMEQKTGATNAAFNKMAEDLDQRLNVVMAQLGNVALRAGTALLSVLVPALEGGVEAVRFLADNSDILASVLVGLAATTIPATVTAIASLTAGASLWSAAFTSAAVATAGLSAAMGVLRAAVSLAGGPVGILIGLLASASTYVLLFRDDTDQTTLAIYDAEAGSKALNAALKNFTETSAPAAGRAAINVANDNYRLADSAYEAARAELAKAKAAAEFARGAGLGGQSSLRDNGVSASFATREAEAALKRLEGAEKSLQQTMRERKSVVTAITGATYEQTEAVEETTIEVRKLRDATGDAFKKAADEQKKLHEAELAHREALQVALVKTADFWKDIYEDVADNLDDLDDRLNGPTIDIARTFTEGLVSGDLDSAFKELGRRAGAEFIDTLFGEDGRSFGGAFTKITSSLQGVATGVQGVVSSIGNLLSGASSIGGAFAGIGSALGGIGGSIAAALGPIGAIIGGVTAVFQLIGSFSKTKVIGAGITGELGPETEAFNFVRKKKSSFFGLTSSKSTKKDANLRATNVLSDAREIVLGEVEDLAGGIGGVARDISQITQKFRIDTRDMSTEEVERVLTAEIEKYQNRIALAALGTRKFTKLGETSAETLARLSGALTTFNSVAELLGTTTLPETLRQADKASEILESVGGANAFTTAANTYFNSFLDLDEQIAQLSKSLVERSKDLGLTAADIDTRDELSAFVKSRGPGPVGVRQQAQAISLAPLVDQLEQLRETSIAAERAIADQVAAEQAALSNAIASEADVLTRRLLQLQGDTEALRDLERAATAASNLGTLENIYMLQDQAEAAAAAAQAEQDLADARREALGLVDGYEFATSYDQRRARADALAGRDVFSNYRNPQTQTVEEVKRLNDRFEVLESSMRIVAANTGRTADATEDSVALAASA